MTTTELCSTCVNSIRCKTWAEWKCLKKEIRFSQYGFKQPIKCSDYKKRGKDFKEPKCQCEDCLKNETLWEEEEE
jgi:hypothetical protein